MDNQLRIAFFSYLEGLYDAGYFEIDYGGRKHREQRTLHMFMMYYKEFYGIDVYALDLVRLWDEYLEKAKRAS